MKNLFIHLRLHSNFSLAEGMLSFKDLSKFCVENNQPAVAHFNMAYLCFQSGQLSQARDHFSEVMKYQAISNDDEATRKAVERTREMLAGLDQTYQRQPSERIASNTSDVMVNEDVGTRTLDIDSRTNVAVPFALPTGYQMDSEQP